MPWYQRNTSSAPKPWRVLIVIFGEMLNLGILAPVLPDIYLDFLGKCARHFHLRDS